MEKKFSNLSTGASTSKIIKLPTENFPSIWVDILTVTIPKMWADDDNYVVSLEINNGYKSDSWTCSNQLYISFPFQVGDSLNSLTQSIQPCTNVVIVMENSIGSSRVNYACMASSQNRFVLSDSSIAVNLFKYKRYYTLCVRVKKHLMAAFMKMNGSWTLVPLLTSLYLSLTLSIWFWVIIAKLRLQT